MGFVPQDPAPRRDQTLSVAGFEDAGTAARNARCRRAATTAWNVRHFRRPATGSVMQHQPPALSALNRR